MDTFESVTSTFTPHVETLRKCAAYREFVPHCSLGDPEGRDVCQLLGEHFVDGQIHLHIIDLLAAHVKLHSVVLNEQREVFPVSRGQIHFLDSHDLLMAGGGVGHFQGVCLPVGNDLKNGSRAVVLLNGQNAASASLELLQVDDEQEAPLSQDGVKDVPEGAVGD